MEDYKTYREVSFFATKLNISSKYLSTVVKEMGGKNSKKWVDDFVIGEIKIRLQSSNEAIQYIADDLNFPDQSFLNKYFRRLTGQTPTEYRRMEF